MLLQTAGRRWVLDANDGVMSTTAVVQGFAGAGADEHTVLFAAAALMFTGGLVVGAAAYAEAAQERAAELEIVEDEVESLQTDPQREFDQLRDHYVERGLEPRLATEVATQLMRTDPLAATLETGYGMIDPPAKASHPWVVALRALLGFISGALPLTLTVLFVPDAWRLAAAVGVVVLCLILTGLLSALSGTGSARRGIARSLLIGLFIAVVSYLAGLSLEMLDGVLPQIDVDEDASSSRFTWSILHMTQA